MFRATAGFRLSLAITLIALVISWQGSAQSRLTGTDAERSVDWDTIRAGDPIPAQMPTSRSDNALDAGFSRKWIEHSLRPMGGPIADASSRLALSIIGTKRSPEDAWANKVEAYLREFIRTKVDVPTPTISRVFCNSLGCLGYLQREGSDLAYLSIYNQLGGEAGGKFALKQEDLLVDRYGTPPGSVWELTVIKRPSVP